MLENINLITYLLSKILVIWMLGEQKKIISHGSMKKEAQKLDKKETH